MMKANEMKSKIQRKLSSSQIIMLGYLALILFGTILLMLPFASKDGRTDLVGALFTATSATCVTGLVVFDTFTKWTLFGKIVIICLIQTGGLGFMTFISIGAGLTGRKLGMKERNLLQESINNPQFGGIVDRAKHIFRGTLIVEGVGALLLMIRMIPEHGVLKGIGNSVFLSISAFCNAGFDLNGQYGEYCSLVGYRDDIYLNIVFILLIQIGAIGFMVWDDFIKYRFKFSKYRLHSKLALSVTLGLNVIGTLLFFAFEASATMADMDVIHRLIASLFASVTPRTAGFNTVDLAEMAPASKFLTVIFMMIGGSPGSTAGGVKTVTVAVLILTAIANMRGSEEINVFGRRLEKDSPDKALSVIAVSLVLTCIGTLVILSVQPELSVIDVMLETFSAINTVGMSTGITRELLTVSRLMIILLMYCGRVGSVSFALIFMRKEKNTGMRNPEESISIG